MLCHRILLWVLLRLTPEVDVSHHPCVLLDVIQEENTVLHLLAVVVPDLEIVLLVGLIVADEHVEGVVALSYGYNTLLILAVFVGSLEGLLAALEFEVEDD